MNFSQLYSHLEKNRILKQASAENIRDAFPDGTYRLAEYKAGEVILSPQTGERCVGLVLSGKAVAEPMGGSDNALLRLLCADDMFGVANLYADGEPFPSVIKAKTSVEVLFLDAERFKELIERDTGALRAYLSFMSRKIVYLNKKISTLTAGSTEKKLAVFLAENQCGGIYKSEPSMSALAELLGVGRASLYRALDSLEDNGFIKRSGKIISVPDKNALLNIL